MCTAGNILTLTDMSSDNEIIHMDDTFADEDHGVEDYTSNSIIFYTPNKCKHTIPIIKR